MDDNTISRISEHLENMTEYLGKAFTGIKTALGFILNGINFILFPEKAYLVSLLAVLGAAAMDIFTKSYAICKKHGGYKNATKSGELFSKSLWTGTETKIISYLTISILTGLSYRVIYLREAGIFLASFVYSVMFMREFQSNIENLMEAGADVQWLLLFSKKKNKELMEKEGVKEESENEKEVNEDYEPRI